MWYPATWTPGLDGAGAYQPRGELCDLMGGPLDGRSAHVHDALEALYVARLESGRLWVGSSATIPEPPDGGVVIGRYLLSPRAGFAVLAWHRVDDERRSPRRPFGPAWQKREAPPSGLLAQLRRRVAEWWNRTD